MSRWTPHTAVYRRLCMRVRREEHTCWLCGGEIDKSLPSYHPWSYAVDDVLPASTHPELREVRDNLRASHRLCNTRRGASLGRGRSALPKAVTVIDDW